MSYYGGYHYHQEDWDSEYDSTWEEEEEEDEQPKSKKVKTSHQFNQHRRAARDMQNYRRGYPTVAASEERYSAAALGGQSREMEPAWREDKSPKPNLLFYQNKIPFEPHGEYIDYIHEHWCYQYDTVERNHNFIQWLFPLREHGMNRCTTPLTLSEIELMKKDKKVMARILESYKLMLGFYGIVLVDADTGMVARAEHNWEERFDNLNNHTHNNLRITRILKCLGEMGYEKLQAPLVRFFLEETLCNGNLSEVKESALEYFMFAVKDKKERQKLVRFAWRNYKPQERFIWGPVDKLRECNPLPQEVKLQIVSEVPGSMPENRRNGLVRRLPGYIAWLFLALLRLVLFIIHSSLNIRSIFRGRIFWFRGEARNEDGLSEGQINVKTEGTRTEKTKDTNMPTVNTSEDYKERSEEVTKSVSERFPKVSGSKFETEHGLVRRALGSIARHFLDFFWFVNRPFLIFFGWALWPFRAILGGRIFWFRGEARNEDQLNEGQIGMNTEGTWTGNKNDTNMPTVNISAEYNNGSEGVMNSENERLLNDHKRQESSKAQLKEQDVSADGINEGNVAENTKEAKLEIEVSESKCESMPEDGNRKLLANVKMQETRQVKENDNSQDDSGKITKGIKSTNLASRNEQLKGTEEEEEEYDDTEVCENSDGHTKDSRTDNYGGTQTANAENQLGEKDISEIEDNGKPSTVGSKDNYGSNTWTQNTSPDTDKVKQVERHNEKTEDKGASNVVPFTPFSGEGDDAKNSEMSKLEDNGQSSTVGSEDNNGSNTWIQKTSPDTDKVKQVERHDEKTEDKGASNMESFSLLSGQEDAAESAEISEIEDNGQSLTVGSEDNNGSNTWIQKTSPDTDKVKQVERHDEKTEDKGASNMESFSLLSGQEDAAESAEISEIEDNGQSLTVGSEDNNGSNTWIQKTSPDTDKVKQVERHDEKTEDKGASNMESFSLLSGQEDAAESAEISEIEDNGQSLTVGSEDNNGSNTWTQNTSPDTDKVKQVERHDEKTEDKGASNMESFSLLSGQEDAAESAEISEIEDNGQSSTVGSEDNNGSNTWTQNTSPDTDKVKQVERHDEKTEDKGASNMESFSLLSGQEDAAESAEISEIEDNGQSSTVGSEDNNGSNTWIQKTSPDTDKVKQVERHDEKIENGVSSMKPVPFEGKGYYAENAEISKIEGNRKSSNVGSKDGAGLNTETQNTLLKTDKAEQDEKDDGNTEDEGAANVGQLPQNGGKRDDDENFRISKKDGNRNTRTMGSKNNDGENIRTQNTEHEKVKTKQDEKVDLTIANVSLDPETEEKANETLESVGESRETEHSEIYKGENKQEDDRTVENESEDSC